jgi:hypothetical protein
MSKQTGHFDKLFLKVAGCPHVVGLVNDAKIPMTKTFVAQEIELSIDTSCIAPKTSPVRIPQYLQCLWGFRHLG